MPSGIICITLVMCVIRLANVYIFFWYKIEILLYLNLSVYVCDYLKKKKGVYLSEAAS